VDLQAVSDKLEIQELFSRYARGVDMKDWDVYRSVFTDDAFIDYSLSGVVAGPRDEVADWLEAGMAPMPWMQHFVTNFEIDLDGDRATARVYFFNPMQLPALAEPSSCGGFYLHDLVRTADGWKSEKLVEHPMWFINPPTEMLTP
jgi:SnoaL-like domain